ncbi:hypothetical protein B0T19DRAFT_254570 [Cercophora scortea]|uniref:Secreted protein n=1 Tax=Cercophora scortea TaxID=314031 RepID=A0AAE0I9H9_9PEZI|nr:hypothetical protein B0T19DRAFT_254570 [Cercophora scortea]
MACCFSTFYVFLSVYPVIQAERMIQGFTQPSVAAGCRGRQHVVLLPCYYSIISTASWSNGPDAPLSLTKTIDSNHLSWRQHHGNKITEKGRRKEKERGKKGR